LFPESDGGGAVSYLRKTLKDRFDVTDLPEGYFYFSISRGGLEVHNVMLELLALQKKDKPLATYGDKKGANEEGEEDDDVDSKVGSSDHDEEDDEDDDEDDDEIDEAEDSDDSDSTSDTSESSQATGILDKEDAFEVDKVTAEEIFTKHIEHDRKEYRSMKEVWDLDSDKRRAKGHLLQLGSDEFMTFEEFTSLRESWRRTWGTTYQHMLSSPDARELTIVPAIHGLTDGPDDSPIYFEEMDGYQKWVISLYGPEFAKKYGSLEAVDPELIPIGMVELFRSSRMKLDQ
jgi:hypothetical protein